MPDARGTAHTTPTPTQWKWTRQTSSNAFASRSTSGTLPLSSASRHPMPRYSLAPQTWRGVPETWPVESNLQQVRPLLRLRHGMERYQTGMRVETLCLGSELGSSCRPDERILGLPNSRATAIWAKTSPGEIHNNRVKHPIGSLGHLGCGIGGHSVQTENGQEKQQEGEGGTPLIDQSIVGEGYCY